MLTVLIMVALAAEPAELENPHLQRAIQQLEAQEEVDALASLEKALAWKHNTPQTLARVYLYVGLAHAALANAAKAVESFRTGRTLDPELALPPRASPRIQEWWDRAGADLPKRASPAPEATVKPAPVEPPPKAEPPVVAVAPEVVAPPLPSTSQSSPTWARPLAYALAGAGALLAGLGGGISAGLAQSDYAAAKAAGDVATTERLEVAAIKKAQTANIFFGAAGGVVLLGVVFFFVGSF